MSELKKEIEIYDGDTALLGEDAPPMAKNIDDLIKYLATISHRFGNTVVDYRISWGASALNKRADKERDNTRPSSFREWISVDILPKSEPTGQCNQFIEPIICAQNETVGIGYFEYKMVDEKWIPVFSFKDFYVLSSGDITHWMPLPSPPLIDQLGE